MTNEQSGVKKTQARAEQALRELMLSGERISQYAVEKRAGLANGTLNYNCPEYRQVREAIRSLKKTCQGTAPVDEQGIEQQIKLKEKYPPLAFDQTVCMSPETRPEHHLRQAS